jgi:hypothetical protein
VHHVVVAPLVSKKLGEILPQRDSLLTVLNRVYDQLENEADAYRSNRDTQEPEFLFNYPLNHFDGTYWHRFIFSVNDHQADGYLFVEAVAHEMWKA